MEGVADLLNKPLPHALLEAKGTLWPFVRSSDIMNRINGPFSNGDLYFQNGPAYCYLSTALS